MIDVAIVGGGPAGLSAAINVAARNKTCVVYTGDLSASWLAKAEQVDNHLGMPGMTGMDMLQKFQEHALATGIEIRHGRIMQIMPMGDFFGLQFEQEIIEAKKIILATGMAKGKRYVGEEGYVGRGVSYCATCDGMLYRGKNVAVVSDIHEGEEDANFLSEVCESVTYFPLKDAPITLKSATVCNGKITEVFGGEFAEGLVVDGEKMHFDGIFIVKASIPASNLVFGLEMNEGAIQVNRLMETNVAGVYACGDCTGWPLQVSNAVGEGLIAAQAAVRALANG